MDIGIGKTSIALRLLGATVFAAGAIGMWKRYPTFAGFALAFILLSSWFGIRLLVDPKPGLKIDASGLWINRKIGMGGAVKWADIKGFRLVRYGHDWQLAVDVDQPQTYREKASSGLKGLLASWSESSLGSPVRVNASLLALDRDDLLRILESYRSRGHI
jgi:hypothetical protein